MKNPKRASWNSDAIPLWATPNQNGQAVEKYFLKGGTNLSNIRKDKQWVSLFLGGGTNFTLIRMDKQWVSLFGGGRGDKSHQHQSGYAVGKFHFAFPPVSRSPSFFNHRIWCVFVTYIFINLTFHFPSNSAFVFFPFRGFFSEALIYSLFLSFSCALFWKMFTPGMRKR